MTITEIRPHLTAEPTAESAELAALDFELAAVEERLRNPQGWGEELTKERNRLLKLRVVLADAQVKLTATTVLAA